MKTQLLSGISIVLICGTLSAQSPDTLMYERFETGGASFLLNSGDLGGVSAATGYNQWTVNNAYTGGSGQLICLGFPFNFTIANTPSQPQAITGGTNTGYLHIVSDAGQAVGVNNCCYLAADGICNFNETHFTKMAQDVNTTGYDSVTVSFLWLCAGGTNIHGEFYYSTDQGTSWSQVTSPISQYKNQSNWTSQSVTLPVFAGQSTLRFGFRFVNQTSTAANEPGFGIDEFLITAKVAGAPPVAAFEISDSTICAGNCIDFGDLTTGNPTSWFWVFQGAATGFSTQQNPSQICYTTPGTYTVTLIVGNANGTDTLTFNPITVYANPSTPVITMSGDTLFASPGFASYQWFLNDTAISGSTDSFHVVLTDGSYTVAVTDTNGCSSLSDSLNFSTGLILINGNAGVEVFPNPVANQLNIRSEVAIAAVSLTDMSGRMVMEMLPGHVHSVQVGLETLADGIYFLRVETTAGASGIMKIVKKQ
jgi:PKD repeat protein